MVSCCWFFHEVLRCVNHHPNRVRMALELGYNDGWWPIAVKGRAPMHAPKSPSVWQARKSVDNFNWFLVTVRKQWHKTRLPCLFTGFVWNISKCPLSAFHFRGREGTLTQSYTSHTTDTEGTVTFLSHIMDETDLSMGGQSNYRNLFLIFFLVNAPATYINDNAKNQAYSFC